MTQDDLAGQARLGVQTPGFVELILFIFGSGRERSVSLADDDVAGGAGAGFFAGVFKRNAVFQQRIAQERACFGVKSRTCGAQRVMGQNGYARHRVSIWVVDID